jgi:hypothetical protein
MKNSNYTIWNRTSDLPICRTVQVSSGTDIYFAGCEGHKTFNVYLLSHLKETEQYLVYVVLYVLCEVRTECIHKTGNTNGVISTESDAVETKLAILLHCCGACSRQQCLYGDFMLGAL